MIDEVKYGTSRPDDGLTDRMTPNWTSGLRDQDLEAFLAKFSCPLTMKVQPSCAVVMEFQEVPEPRDAYFWRVRQVDGGFILEQPGGTGHIGIRSEVFHSDLLEKWAEEETSLLLEITHGP